MLTVSQVIALSLACAPQAAPNTLAAIARVESGLDPLAIGVNGGPPVARAASRAQAIRQAETLIADGRDIDLGIGQINVRNLGWLGLTVAGAFDPCLNLAASARVLAHGYRRAAGDAQARLRTALSYYNTGHPRRGFANGYVAKVSAAAGIAPPGLRPTNFPAVPASPRTAPAWDVFAPAAPRGPAWLLTAEESPS